MMRTNPHNKATAPNNQATVHKGRVLPLMTGALLSVAMLPLCGMKAEASSLPDPGSVVPDSVFIESDGTVVHMEVGQHDDEGIVDNSNARQVIEVEIEEKADVLTVEQEEAIAFTNDVCTQITEQLKVIEEQVEALQALNEINDQLGDGNTGGDGQQGNGNTGEDGQQVNVPPLELDIGENITLHQNIFDAWRGEDETALCEIQFTFMHEGVEYVATVPRGADLSTLPGGSNYTLGNNCEGILYLLQEAGASYSPKFITLYDGGIAPLIRLDGDISLINQMFLESGVPVSGGLVLDENGNPIFNLGQNGGTALDELYGSTVIIDENGNETVIKGALPEGYEYEFVGYMEGSNGIPIWRKKSENVGGAIYIGNFNNNLISEFQNNFDGNGIQNGGALYNGGDGTRMSVVDPSPVAGYHANGYDEDGNLLLRNYETGEIIKYSELIKYVGGAFYTGNNNTFDPSGGGAGISIIGMDFTKDPKDPAPLNEGILPSVMPHTYTSNHLDAG